MRAIAACAVLLVAVLLPVQTWAELLLAIKPGVMCTSAEALAKLTLPDGSSRSAARNASPEDKRIANDGHCLDLAKGSVYRTKEIRRNTSVIVVYDGFEPTEEMYFVANVDFARFVPTGPYWSEVMRRCPEKLDRLYTEPNDVGIVDLYGMFFDSLPKDLQDRAAKHKSKRECDVGWRCVAAMYSETISNAGLELNWVDFQCEHR